MSSELLLIALALFLLGFIWLILYATHRVKRGPEPLLRPISGFEMIKGLNGRAIETGRALHLSLGVGSVANETTADTLAGLSVLDYLAEQSAITSVPPVVSMADPIVMLYAQNAVRHAHRFDPESANEAYQNIRWIAPQPTAYAAGVMNLLSLDKAEANVMIGSFGDEYLLMGEVAARRKAAHIGGTSNPNTLPFIYVSAQQTLLGEEIYAAGAYLRHETSHIGSLIAQDILRWLIILLILGTIVVNSILTAL